MARLVISATAVILFACTTISHQPALEQAKGAAVRFMAAQLPEHGADVEVLFLRDVRGRDPKQSLLSSLSDLNVRPISAVQFIQERREDVQLHAIDKRTRKKGQVIEILRAKQIGASEVQLDVRYSVVSSGLMISFENDGWVVKREEVKTIVVASIRPARAVS